LRRLTSLQAAVRGKELRVGTETRGGGAKDAQTDVSCETRYPADAGRTAYEQRRSS